MDTVQDLVDAVMEAGFDVSLEPQALKWLSRAQRTMCARARAFRGEITIGTGAEGVKEFPVPPTVAELLELRVGGEIWPRGRHSDIANGTQGRLWLSGPGGIAAPNAQSGGGFTLQFYPTPTAGDPITAYCSLIPADLSLSDDTTLLVPQDFTDALVSGAIATGLLRDEGRADQSSPFAQVFNEACTELRRRVSREMRGSGVARVRVVGFNA